MEYIKTIINRLMMTPDANSRFVFFIQSVGALILMAVLVWYFVHASVESQRNYYEMAGVVSLFGGVAGASRYFTKRKGESGVHQSGQSTGFTTGGTTAVPNQSTQGAGAEGVR